MKTLNKAKDKLINGGGLFMFLRSSVAAQAASWVDLGLGFVLFSWVGLSTGLSTGIGAVRRYNQLHNQLPVHVPRQGGVSKRAVAVKYILIWTGSLLLNTYGTSMLYNLMSGSEFFAHMGFSDDGCYAASRIFTSLVVSLAWNFLMREIFLCTAP